MRKRSAELVIGDKLFSDSKLTEQVISQVSLTGAFVTVTFTDGSHRIIHPDYIINTTN